MNILILSCGTRRKIVQYFKHALKGQGRVIAADCNQLAPALYEADQYYLVPRIDADNYLEQILQICRKETISGVLSLIDPELSLLARNAKQFMTAGATVIGSSYALCEMAMDKWQMYQWLCTHRYPCAKTFNEKETFYEAVIKGAIKYPVIVKPAKGSASAAVTKAYGHEMVEALSAQHENLLIQEFLHGQEIGADCYVDLLSGEVISIFTKKKLAMRAGETDQAVSIKDKRLFYLIEKFLKEAGYRGQVDLDLFEINGEYFISEVNPRFGGGYPHAYLCGVDTPAMIVKNLCGKQNQPCLGQYEAGRYMVKYSEVLMIEKL